MAQPTLARSMQIQARIVGALLLREILTRYGRHNLGFLWLFIEPMLFTLGVTLLWTALRGVHGSDLPIVGFAITGYSSVLLWRNMPARCLNAIEPNHALMHHRNVCIIDIFAARLLLEFVGVTTSFSILVLLCVWLGLLALPENLMLVAGGWALLAWFGAALAVAIACLAERSGLLEKLWHPLSYLLFPLSGAGFMVDWLPVPAREFVLLLPMVHCTEILRDGYFGSAVRTYHDANYVVVFCLVLSLIALALERDASRKVVPI